MTAYGRASKASPLGHFSAEIQSVNRKYLEINIFLSKELTRFESEIRKWIGQAVQRGQVTVKISAYFDRTAPLLVRPNLPLARQIKRAWDEIARDLQIKQEFSLDLLKEETGILVYEEDLQNAEEVLQELHSVVSEALKPFLEMKQKEGRELYEDFNKRLKNLDHCLDKIAERAPGATLKYREKLKQRLEEVLPGSVENEDKILREIALYAEKIDIAEEITRFRSHLKQAKSLLEKKEGSVGKTFEFLLQELNREANTIGSKSSDVDVSHLVVEIKAELERMREQIQNVE